MHTYQSSKWSYQNLARSWNRDICIQQSASYQSSMWSYQNLSLSWNRDICIQQSASYQITPPNWWQCSMVKTRSTMFGTWSTPFFDHVILTLFWPCSDHVQSWPCFMFGTWSTLVCHCSLTFLCWPCFDRVLTMFWPCSDHDHSWPCSMFGTLKSQTIKKYIKVL